MCLFVFFVLFQCFQAVQHFAVCLNTVELVNKDAEFI